VPAGAALALVGNVDTADYQQSRRVTITGADAYPHKVLYRYILLALADGDEAQAAKWLFPWLHLATDREARLASYDPRLGDLLQRGPLRSAYAKRVAAIYNLADRENGKPYLDSLWHEDQLPRTLNKYLENMFFYVDALDSAATFWSVNLPELTWPAVARRDSLHGIVVVDWLKENSWPKSSEVGETAAKTVPLLLLHAGDTTAMATYLPQFYARCRNGEADWNYYAILFDRHRVVRGLPQRYGTQYQRNPTTGKNELLPVEDWAEMNRLRQQFGAGLILGGVE
jgi:hypothetical protein